MFDKKLTIYNKIKFYNHVIINFYEKKSKKNFFNYSKIVIASVKYTNKIVWH